MCAYLSSSGIDRTNCPTPSTTPHKTTFDRLTTHARTHVQESRFRPAGIEHLRPHPSIIVPRLTIAFTGKFITNCIAFATAAILVCHQKSIMRIGLKSIRSGCTETSTMFSSGCICMLQCRFLCIFVFVMLH